VDGAVRVVEEMASSPRDRLAGMGARAREVIDLGLGKSALCGRFADIVEDVMERSPVRRPS